MRLIVASTALVIAVASSASAQAVGNAPYTLWPAPSVQKVFRDDSPVDPGGAVVMSAAANEFECAQIVITAGDERLSDVEVSVSALRRGRHSIRAAGVRLFLPHYVNCPAAKREFPDPLPPLDAPFDVAASSTQPIWLEVFVPKGTAPGRYECTVTVAPGNAAASTVPVHLAVYPFELPDEVHSVTAFGLSIDSVFDKHGLSQEERQGLAGRKLHRAYYECLLDHKVSPYYLPVDLESPWAASYLNDPRLTSFVIPFREDEGYLRGIAEYLRERGWLDKAYFYVVDEPIGREQYDRIKEVADLLHRADPDLQLVAPFYRAPDWDDALTTFDVLTGYLDIWCPNIHYFDLNPLIYEQIKERQRALEDAWCYVCCGPGAPYNNFFVQMDGFSHRLIFTQMWRLGVPGLLYWSTTYWPRVDDPWESMMTVPDINESIYGDGSLLYPGVKVGIDGPVASIRLKLIRDGIEDYEYLRLLAETRGQPAALRAARRLCRSLTDYTHDSAELAAVRDKVALEIAN